MIRGLLTVIALGGLALIIFTVPLGERTAAQHFRRIWASDETQELVTGAKQTAAPVVDRIKRGVGAGVREAAEEDLRDANTTHSRDLDEAAGPSGATPDGGPTGSAREKPKLAGPDKAHPAKASKRPAKPRKHRPRAEAPAGR
jgi:hypothetical protein